MYCTQDKDGSWKRQWSVGRLLNRSWPSDSGTSTLPCCYHYLPCKEGLLWFSTAACWDTGKHPQTVSILKEGNSVNERLDLLVWAWLLFSFVHISRGIFLIWDKNDLKHMVGLLELKLCHNKSWQVKIYKCADDSYSAVKLRGTIWSKSFPLYSI